MDLFKRFRSALNTSDTRKTKVRRAKRRTKLRRQVMQQVLEDRHLLAGDVLNEPFDDSSQFTANTALFSDGSSDYFGIADGDSDGGEDFGSGGSPNVKAYTGFTDNFLTGQDLDGEGASLPIEVSWTGLDISGKTGLEVSFDIAEFVDSATGHIDTGDSILVQAQIDSAGFTDLIEFRGNRTDNNGNNGIFAVDTNGDGLGDGTTLGAAATNFIVPIAGTGSLLDLRISFDINSGSEDIGLDNLMVSSSSTPVAGVQVTPSGGTTDVDEAGPTSDTFDVLLTSEPTADVTINISTGDGETTVDLGTLTFTNSAGASPWNVAQTVTVTAVDDSEVEAAHTGLVTFAATSTDTDYASLSIPDLSVNITDNDAASTTAAIINEFVANHTGNDTDTFVEVLVPSATGITDISSLTILEVDGDSGSVGQIVNAIDLTSTDANGYAVENFDPQNNTLTFLLVDGFTGAVNDDLDTNDDGTLDVTPWTSIIDSVGTSDGGTGDFVFGGVDLAAGLDGNTFAYGGASRIPNGTDTDTVADWVRNDFDGAGLPSFPGVTADPGEGISTPGADNAIEPAVPAVTVVESDGSTDVDEAGPTSDTFTVQLETEPTSDVTITVTITDSETTSDVAVLTFTDSVGATPWNVAQTVTITAVDDNDTEALHTGIVSLVVGGSDTAYTSLTVPDVTVNITDNDGSSGLSAGDLVVNEIMFNPAAVSDTDGEYVEIWNTTGAAIDIDGFVLSDQDFDSHTINNGGPLVVPAGGFVVLGRNSSTASNNGVTVDYQYADFFLSNSGDEVVIADNFGLVLDTVAYDNTFPLTSGASLELIPGQTDPATDNDTGTNWQASTTALGTDFGTPGAVNSGGTTPGNDSSFVLINEILFDTAGTDSPNEYIELRGDAGTTVPANTYLINVEGDADSGFGIGKVSNVFDLSGLAFGSNGYLVLSQDQGSSPYTFDSNANVITSSTSDFGGLSFFSSDGSSELENASNTFLLVNSPTVITTSDDVDEFDSGFLDSGLSSAWTELDSVAILDGDAFDIAYSSVSFTYADSTTPPLGYVARLGDSTGMTTGDWVAGEVTGTAPNFTLNSNTVPASMVGAALDHIGASNATSTPGVTVAPTGASVDVDETGPTSSTFTVVLDSEPTADVTVNVLTADGETTVDLGTLTFTDSLGATPWDTPQTVTVTAFDDPDFEGPHTGTISFTTSSSDTNFDALTVADLTVNITDNDPAVTPAALINEFVKDHTSTDSDAFVEIFLPGATGATDLSTLTLLEIEGEGSTIGNIDKAITLGTTDANGYFLISNLTSTFDPENGTLSFLLVDGFSGTVGDDIDTDNDGTIDVTPWTSIVDSVGSSEGTAGEFVYGGVDLTPGLDGNSFEYGGASRIPNGTDTDTTADWVRNDFSGAGLASFPAVVADPGEAINTPGAENMIEPFVPAVTVTESDGSTDVDEDQTITDTFDVVLETEPTADVTITISTTDGETTVDLGTLTFTNGAGATPWNVAQTVTVTGFDDGDNEGNHTGLITFAVSSTDTDYNGLTVSDVTVNITDNDGSSGLSAGDLVVNEIMQNPAAVNDSVGEYFEIFNTTGAAIDIDGFVISDNDGDSHTINNGGPLSIAAGGYLVLGINSDTGTNGGVPVDYQYTGISLGNGADEVIISDNFGLEIDRVEYDGGPNFPDPGGASMELIPGTANPGTGNDLGSNWQVATAAISGGDLGTPGAVNTSTTTPVTVTSVAINDGSAQRSQITSVTVTFDGLVSHTELTSAAFGLTNIDSSTALLSTQLLVAPGDTGGVTTVVLTFGAGASVADRDGTGDLGNSLADGNYELTILSSQITGLAADHVFGGHNAAVAESTNDDFFRLYGDIDGDGDTDANDLNDSFAPAFFSVVGGAAFNPALDGDGDGDVDANDLNDHFGPNFFAVRQ